MNRKTKSPACACLQSSWQAEGRQVGERSEQIYRFPLRESAGEKLNRQLRSDVRDEQLADLVVNLYEEDNLCLVQEAQETQEPRIICSLGLKKVAAEQPGLSHDVLPIA